MSSDLTSSSVVILGHNLQEGYEAINEDGSDDEPPGLPPRATQKVSVIVFSGSSCGREIRDERQLFSKWEHANMEK